MAPADTNNIPKPKSVACLYINKLSDVDLDVLREIVCRDFELAVQTSKA